jgi:hypothetical protein
MPHIALLYGGGGQLVSNKYKPLIYGWGALTAGYVLRGISSFLYNLDGWFNLWLLLNLMAIIGFGSALALFMYYFYLAMVGRKNQ